MTGATAAAVAALWPGAVSRIEADPYALALLEPWSLVDARALRLGLALDDELQRINALKVVTTTVANGVAVLLFIVEGQVLWQYCLLMMVTGALGGYVGGHTARSLNPRLMRGCVTALGFAMAGYFFWRNGGL